MKALSEFPQYSEAQAKLTKIRGELNELSKDREQTAAQIYAAKANNVDTRAQILLDGGFVNTEALSKQIGEIDQAITIHERAVELATVEYERVLSRVSAEICQEELLPNVEAQLKENLQHLKKFCEGQAKIEAMRDEAHRKGIKTGSVPHCIFSQLGQWDDPTGGIVTGFRRYIAEHFPGLKKETE